MAVAQSNGISTTKAQPFSCYKVSSLSQTILDSSQSLRLEDRYVLGKQLGWGQFGVIRECSDKFTGELFACKSIAKERLVTLDDVRSVKLEIEIMTRLSGHPNVVDLKAVYEEEDYVHLVMELCAGGELFHRLEKHGRFSESEACVLFSHLMQVVMYCHDKGVVHRDLKPENILLATKASSSPIKLADFGLATYVKPGQSLYGTVGSPFYIAPEVLTGGYNQAADVWSAGVILYILLSGMPPFWGKTKSRIFDAVRAADLRFPSDHWDRISASAKDLIRGMLCTDPAKRLTAAEVLDHGWIRDCRHVAEEPYESDGLSCRQLDLDGSSFSTPFVSRNQDFSFSSASPLPGDAQLGISPAFTCRSSFSSFLLDCSTPPCTVSVGFSFQSCCASDGMEFSSPVQSMPSFDFFSPSPAVEQRNNSLRFTANVSGVDAFQKEEASLGRLFILDSSASLGHEVGEKDQKAVDVRRGVGAPASRVFGIHSKRNHTIGLGEFEQLDLMVTESVIRWASCTHLPSAPSLRSSLVC
ncbi:calcium-dependent protein kinase 26-like [Macadamia integrifolia]|uniref:calcium-dependent protein kinase 26-like n=1 Tax=Macadamia integrifolia TaxID=60698 RepID=UPI001C52EB66|nr:calcium-dependent protein kinase 26-like [Macadamia integrifolia]XP_042481801.1 calcium-dependent protein kinase 26-like [Macadamia integrifolia]